MNGPDDEPEAAAAERIRLAHDRIRRIERTFALCMLCWLATSMLLLWAIA